MAAVRQDVLLGTWYAKRSAESDKAGCLCSRGFQAATVSALLHTKGAFAEILTACRRPQTVRRRLQTVYHRPYITDRTPQTADHRLYIADCKSVLTITSKNKSE